jgi:hypothetical protein
MTDDSATGSATEVGRYASRSRYPGAWMLAHVLLMFVPFVGAIVVAGNTTSPIDFIAMLTGLGLMALLGGPLRERSVVWTAFVLMLLFPQRE